MFYLGIDVSKAKVDCAWLRDGVTERVKTHVFGNDAEGANALLNWALVQTKSDVEDLHFTMEATGVYHQALADALFQAGAQVSVVNPLQIKRYAQSLGKRSKTDKKDSILLARFGATQQPRLWQPEPANIRVLKALMARLEAIEKDNPKLKGVLNKQYGRLQIDQAKLIELINLISEIPFRHETLQSKDILGHVYEYFLGQFTLAEGKKGGQFYTPKSIVSLIVEMLQPFAGRVYDPAMGSGGFFVQSERFIKEHGGKIGDVSIYGQEYNHTTWQLAAMNMVIRGLDFNFGKEPANTFTNDQHPDLRANFIMANPPFNMKEWDTGVSDDDPRWQYGTPPSNNANFAWLQHMLYHLAPNGSLGLLLANGSMSSNTRNEGAIRKALLENDLIECMVALPGQLFTNTQIPACIWFLTRNKQKRDNFSNRTGEVLFIDARNLGYMKDRVLRDFKKEDIDKIAGTFHDWQKDEEYGDEAGFCKSATLKEIAKHDYVLTPGRYVGAVAEEDDGEPFAEKMARLTGQLKGQFVKSSKLEKQIKENLAGLGYDIRVS